MRDVLNEKLEAGRLRTGEFRSRRGDLHGAFLVMGPKGVMLKIISSGTGPGCEGWEHVSVSTEHRTPNWTEMCWTKNLFWREDECCIQYHPPESDYVSHHPYVLHIWRPLDADIPMPPSTFVGPNVTGSQHE